MKSRRLIVFSSILVALACAVLTGCVHNVSNDIVVPMATPTPVAIATPAPTPPTIEPVDGGSREGATGTVVPGDRERVEAYLVAEGDKLVAIAERFGVDVTELTRSNGVRHSYNDGELYPGDYVMFREDGAEAAPVYNPPLADSGIREYATGQVILDDAGQIVKYVVAEGDRGDEIGLRLGTDATQIYHDTGEFEGQNILNWGQIHPGDVLRFEVYP